MSWKALGWGVAVVLVWMTASVAPCRVQTGNDLLRHCTDALRVIDNGYQKRHEQPGAQLRVTDCNRNEPGLQSAHFWDHIICL
jgi:hypothetical protein